MAETFTVAWRRFHEVPEEPLPWLYGVARKVIANHRRSRRRWLNLLARLHREPADVETPGDSLEPVRLALSRLRPADQELLRLSAWEGLSHEQIGATLDISANAVAIRAHRARKQLAVELGALGLTARKTEASAGQVVR